MVVFEIIMWLITVLFLIGMVMAFEISLSSKVGLSIVCISSIFFGIYFAVLNNFVICVLFVALFLIALRFLIRTFSRR